MTFAVALPGSKFKFSALWLANGAPFRQRVFYDFASRVGQVTVSILVLRLQARGHFRNFNQTLIVCPSLRTQTNGSEHVLRFQIIWLF